MSTDPTPTPPTQPPLPGQPSRPEPGPGQPEPPLDPGTPTDPEPEQPMPDPVPDPGEQLPDVDQGRPSGQDQAPVDVPRSDPSEMLGAPRPEGDVSGSAATQREPEEWVTGDDPATQAQKTYLDALAREVGEQIPAEGLTKAQASEHIDRLQARTGRPPRRG